MTQGRSHSNRPARGAGKRVRAGARLAWALVLALGVVLPVVAQNSDARPPGGQVREAFEGLIRDFNSAGQGITPLMKAARANKLSSLQRQLAKGVDVNKTSRYGWTALMFAAAHGHGEVVERLLEAGADPNVVSERITGNTQGPIPRTTALAEAIAAGHLKVARSLLASGATADPTAVAIAGGVEDLTLLQQMHAQGAV